MKWLNKKKEKEELNYWLSISDMMSALLLSLLLVIMLLILYVVRMPEEEMIDQFLGDNDHEYVEQDDEHDWDNEVEGRYWNKDDGHEHDYDKNPDGGTGTGDGEGDNEGDYEYRDIGLGDYDGYEKAAVYVSVIDAETGRVIQEPDVRFELRNVRGEQVTLFDYYPVKTAFRQYATSEQGVFFLPEKIWLGSYKLIQVSEPLGYDAAEDREFIIEERHDWDEPFTIQIPLFPARNVIRMRMTDAETGKPAPGGVYDVVAALDIITADGTLRYSAGEVVSQITIDEEGNGQSGEVYLGQYLIRESGIPQYYAGMKQPLDAAATKALKGVAPMVYDFTAEKTTYTVELCDELYGNILLEGAQFSLTREGGAISQTFTTDEAGRITLDQLEKDTVYHLRQQSSAPGYIFDEEDVSFAVAADGRIEGEAKAGARLVNRMMRVNISIRDMLLRTLVSDNNVTLYTESGEVVKTWTSTGLPEMLTGMAPGKYKLAVTGIGGTEKLIEIRDEATIQNIECGIWTNMSFMALAAAGISLVIVIVVVVFLISRRKQRR